MTACSDATEHRRRLEARTRSFTSVPEPTWSDVERRAQQYPPWTDPHLVIDTIEPLEDALAAAMSALSEQG